MNTKQKPRSTATAATIAITPILMALVAMPVPAAPADPATGPLSASQLQEVRHAGRALLVARKKQKEAARDPELRAQIDDYHQSLVGLRQELLSLQPSDIPVPLDSLALQEPAAESASGNGQGGNSPQENSRSPNSQAGGNSQASANPQGMAFGANPDQPLSPVALERLDAVREKRQALVVALQERLNQAPTNGEQKAHGLGQGRGQKLLGNLDDHQTQFQDFPNLSRRQQLALLSDLQERSKPHKGKRNREEIEQPPMAAGQDTMTPTIRTATRHRK